MTFSPFNKSTTIQRVYIEKAIPTKPFCRFVFRVDFDRQCFTLTLDSGKNTQTIPLSDLKLSPKIIEQILKFSKIHDKSIERKLKDILKKSFHLFTKYQAVAIELSDAGELPQFFKMERNWLLLMDV